MRIVIDMQGAQSSGNWNRGIGRYTMALALAIANNRGEHEVVLALNGAFSASVERLRAEFEGVLPQECIRVWYAVPPMAHSDSQNNWRRQSGELVREAFLYALSPDFVIVSSLFEGLDDDAVTSIKRFSGRHLTAVILYDLIPFIHRQPYLDNPVVKKWYMEKIENFRRSDLWLAISESSSQEGVEYLKLPAERCVSISTDADEQFQVISVTAEVERSVREKYKLSRNFVMYTGGIDYRKNIEGLIRAYAKLSTNLRAIHQLAIVCSVQEDSRNRLIQLAGEHGLNAHEIILTGFVPEEDLVILYNLCAAFIFPSWHEGFGLPALEAMRCGAPVIAANTSSLPEVVGWADALFDPHSDEAIAQAIERVLTDRPFCDQLRAHGRKRATKFSWDETAERAIVAMERVVAQCQPHGFRLGLQHGRPKLAYVSPLPPERSGISDYSAELLPAFALYYEIDVVVAQHHVTSTWISANCPIRSVDWFIKNHGRYDRIVYHFGNSPFHQHMFGLLKNIPGVVVLHDFFLSGIQAHREFHGGAPHAWADALYASHGYAALHARDTSIDPNEIIWRYPANLPVLQRATGVIVHSENSRRLAAQWYGSEAGADWAVVPLLRSPPPTQSDRAAARAALGLATDDLLVCSFGILGPTKLNHRLLQAWLASDLAANCKAHLVFVGENHPGDYGRNLLRAISVGNVGKRIKITGWADGDTFRRYLAAADIGVQLRTLSRGETSAAVLDCMNYGMATIINAHGNLADIDSSAVWALPDAFDDDHLIEALNILAHDPQRRRRLGDLGAELVRANHSPAACAGQYAEAIEGYYQRATAGLPGLLTALALTHPVAAELNPLASSLANSFPPAPRMRQLLVDVSELAQHDAKTGIQRVVRGILKEWLLNPPSGFRVEPVYATLSGGYRYARQFTEAFLGLHQQALLDEPIDHAPGDIFIALDFQTHVQVAHGNFFQNLRRQGVSVQFVVYDLLLELSPEFFQPGGAHAFRPWLSVVAASDAAHCISKAVANQLEQWISSHETSRKGKPLIIDWFHLGADVETSSPTRGLPVESPTTLAQVAARPSFLMVGTLEPRKGHAQVLDAVDILWRDGQDINLVIVGKQGWMIDALVQRLHQHPQAGKKLFWLEGISDEYLERIYAASTCLIAASYGEGFGLPLIEAAQLKLPIIVRDIPVFREVAGEHAYYFNAAQPDELAQALRDWLALFQFKTHPCSNAMPWLTWKESAENLMKNLLGNPGGNGAPGKALLEVNPKRVYGIDTEKT